jgi:phosphohistidine phosphatase
MVEMSTRTLVILRHAKSADPAGVADAERPLTHRGESDATAAGVWLVAQGLQPDIVLCSPARRTRQTWHRVAGELTTAPNVSYVERLYAAGLADVLSVLSDVDDTVGVTLLIGHNPSVSQLSALLDPSAAAPDGLSTAGIAVHTWSGDWSDGGAGTAALTASYTARG